MKKNLIGFLFALFLLCGCTWTVAYMPTAEDEQLIEEIEVILHNHAGQDDMKRWDFVLQLIKLNDRYGQNDRLNYLLTTLVNNLHQPLIDEKKKSQERRDRMKEEFYQQHGDEIYSKDFDVPSSCFDHYEFVDTLSWLYDHPTSLTLATWFRESNCRQAGTHNARGPFQITTKHYGYGAMTRGAFLGAVQDYLAFSNEKHNRYHRANGGELEVELGYDNRTLSGVVYHGALYNGLGGSNIWGILYPASTGYVYANFTEEYADYGRDGVLTMMVKVISKKVSLN